MLCGRAVRAESLWGGSQSPACRSGNWAAVGRRHLLLRAQRVLKGMGMIGKKGKTAGVSLLVRPPRAAALSARDARAHMARRGRRALRLFLKSQRFIGRDS